MFNPHITSAAHRVATSPTRERAAAAPRAATFRRSLATPASVDEIPAAGAQLPLPAGLVRSATCIKALLAKHHPVSECPTGFYDWAAGPPATNWARDAADRFIQETIPTVCGAQSYQRHDIPCGQSGFASFKITGADGAAYHLKRPNTCPPPDVDMAHEAALGHWAASQHAAPEVVFVDPSRKILLSRWVGDAQLNPRVLREDTGTIAKILQTVRSLHTAARDRVPEVQAHDPLTKVRESLNDLRKSQRFTANDFHALEEYMHGLLNVMANLPYAAGLVHNDFHHNNIKITADGRVLIFDWASASWGRPLFDVAHLAVNLDLPPTAAVAQDLLQTPRAGPIDIRDVWQLRIAMHLKDLQLFAWTLAAGPAHHHDARYFCHRVAAHIDAISAVCREACARPQEPPLPPPS